MEALPYVPKNLMFLTSKMDQYHRNRFRLETVSSQTASPGSVVTVNLPESALIDMKSFRWHFKFNGSGNGLAGDEVFAKMPADAQSLISRVEVYVNGVQVMSCNEYNSIYRLLKIQRGNPEKDQSIDRLLQNGQIDDADANDVKDVMVVDWLGFLGETSTRFLPTDLLGQIQVRLTLAGNEVLVPKQFAVPVGTAFTTPAAATNAQSISYNLSDMFFTIDSITVDPAYNMLMRDALQTKDLELNYKEYYNTTSDHGTNGAFVARFSVASQSVDKIYATIREANYQTVGIKAHELDASSIGDRFLANYFRFRDFRDPAKKFEWQFSLNNVKHPQYYATQLEAAADLSYANDKVGQSTSGTLVSSIEGFEDGLFVTPLRLNHPQGGCISRGEGCDVISGYNTKNINTSLTWEAKGMLADAASPKVALIVVETTPTARVGMGRQLAVVY